MLLVSELYLWYANASLYALEEVFIHHLSIAEVY